MMCPHCNKAIAASFKCPQCAQVRPEEHFTRINGDRAIWCAVCRHEKNVKVTAARVEARRIRDFRDPGPEGGTP